MKAVARGPVRALRKIVTAVGRDKALLFPASLQYASNAALMLAYVLALHSCTCSSRIKGGADPLPSIAEIQHNGTAHAIKTRQTTFINIE